MNELFKNCIYAGVILSIAAYGIGALLKKKLKIGFLNPLLVAIVLTIVFLATFRVDYKVYNEGAKYLSYLLTPATICLAVPLYERFELLKKNGKAVIIGITTGVLTSLVSVLILALIFRLSRTEYITFLPKSITTAIGIGVSGELGGNVSLTAAIIICTGVLGNIIAEKVCKLCRIEEPVAKGVAIGTSSHAIGTSKAMELGKTEGAMSSLSLVVSGLMTVVLAGVFANIAVF